MKYKIERKKIDAPVERTSNGKKFTFVNVGLYFNNKWHNNSFFATDKSLDEIKNLPEGGELYLDLSEQEYTAKDGTTKVANKFKMQNKLDVLSDRMKSVESKIFIIEQILNIK